MEACLFQSLLIAFMHFCKPGHRWQLHRGNGVDQAGGRFAAGVRAGGHHRAKAPCRNFSRVDAAAIIPPRCAPAPPLPHRRGKCAARCSLAWRTGSGPASFPGRSIPEPRRGLCPPAGRWPDGWRTRSWSPCSEGVSLTVFPSGRQRPLANTLSA
jgi:hypothetical protein